DADNSEAPPKWNASETNPGELQRYFPVGKANQVSAGNRVIGNSSCQWAHSPSPLACIGHVSGNSPRSPHSLYHLESSVQSTGSLTGTFWPFIHPGWGGSRYR